MTETSADTKACPICASQVSADERICGHCSHNFQDSQAPLVEPPAVLGRSPRARSKLTVLVAAVLLLGAVGAVAGARGDDKQDPARESSSSASENTGGLSDDDLNRLRQLGPLGTTIEKLQPEFAEAAGAQDAAKMHALALKFLEIARESRDGARALDNSELRSKAVNAGATYVAVGEAMVAYTTYLTDENVAANKATEGRLLDDLAEARAQTRKADQEFVDAMTAEMTDEQSQQFAAGMREWEKKMDAESK